MIKKLRQRFIRITMIALTVVMLILCLIVNSANVISVNQKLCSTLSMISRNKGTIPKDLPDGNPPSDKNSNSKNDSEVSGNNSNATAQTGSTSDQTGSTSDQSGSESTSLDSEPGGKNSAAAPDNLGEPQTGAPTERMDNAAKPGGPFDREMPFSTRYFVLRYNEDGTLLKAELDNIAEVTESNASEYLNIAKKHGLGYGYTTGYKYYVEKAEDGQYMAIFLNCRGEVENVRKVMLLSLAAMAFCVICVYIIVVLCSRRAIDPVVKASVRQKQFITDASHELKTPVTVITTSLKVLEMETGPQKWIDKARAQTEKLTRLINALVTLAKTDEETGTRDFADFDISAAVAETVESFKDIAAEKGLNLKVEAEEGVTYRGNEYAIRQLTSILCDNALKYATNKEPIVFSLKQSRKNVILTASNACEQTEQAPTDKLFDRFYRADAARSTGGFGIGLSIAKNITELHRGTISADYPKPGVILFTAVLKR